MRCVSVTEENSKAKQRPMLTFKFIGIEGTSKDKPFKLYCSLEVTALWKLRQTLRALGIETPDDPSELDPADVEDIEVIGDVGDHEYDGKTYSKLLEIRAAEDVETQSTATTTAAPAKGNGKQLPKLGASEVQEMQEDELEEIVLKYRLDIDLRPPPRLLAARPTPSSMPCRLEGCSRRLRFRPGEFFSPCFLRWDLPRVPGRGGKSRASM